MGRTILSPRSYKLLLTLCLVAAVGLISRQVPVGFLIWDKYLGDAVYAAVFYLLLSLVWPGGAVTTRTIFTIVFVVAVEAFQLTQIPAQLIRSESLLVRAFTEVVLGTKFSWWDILAYGVGTGGIVLLDSLYLKSS